MKKLLLLLFCFSNFISCDPVWAQDFNQIGQEDDMLFVPKQFERQMPMINMEAVSGMSKAVGTYFEIDYKTYLFFGSSVPKTLEYFNKMFAEVQKSAKQDSITMYWTNVKVWTTQDPYNGDLQSFGSAMEILRPKCDLSFLLSKSRSGGIAWVDVLGSTFQFRCAVGGIEGKINPFPMYCWDVDMILHEWYHNICLQHTHNCLYLVNGIPNQALDGCGDAAGYNGGSCPDGAYPPNDNPQGKGRKMSYCHINCGTDLSLGLHPEMRNLARTSIALHAGILINPDTIVGVTPPVDICSLQPLVTPLISLSTTTPTVASGGQVRATSTVTGGGTSPKYKWFVNGIATTGTSANFNSNIYQNTTVQCQLYNGDSCVTTHYAMSNPITFTVSNAPELCIHKTHRQYFNRLTGVTMEITDEVTDPDDKAVKRMIQVVNLDSMTAEVFEYTGNTYKFTKGLGRYSMTNGKVCSNGTTLWGYGIQFQVTKFEAPVNVAFSSNVNTIFMGFPVPSGTRIQVRYRPVGLNYWIGLPIQTISQVSITGISPNTMYEIQAAYQMPNKVVNSAWATFTYKTQDVTLVSFRLTKVSGIDYLEFAANFYSDKHIIKVNGLPFVSPYVNSPIKVGANKYRMTKQNEVGTLKTGDVVTLENYWGHNYTVTK